MKRYTIYKSINQCNNKIYVGKHITNNISDNYMGSGKLVLRAIKKYGRQKFKKIILEECSNAEELNEREKFWIEELNARDKKVGYNITIGGEGDGNKTSIAAKKRLVDPKNNSMYGKKHTEESKQKMSDSHKGKVLSDEHKRNIGRSVKGKLSGQNHPMYGKSSWNKGLTGIYSTETLLKMKNAPVSEETRSRMSIAAKKLKQCPYCLKEVNTGNYNRWHNNNCKFMGSGKISFALKNTAGGFNNS